MLKNLKNIAAGIFKLDVVLDGVFKKLEIEMNSHESLKFKTVELENKSKETAMNWICWKRCKLFPEKMQIVKLMTSRNYKTILHCQKVR